MKLLIYALGGGLGHLQRSLSLAKAATLRDHTATILCNSSALPRISKRLKTPGVSIQAIQNGDSLIPEVHRWIQRPDYDALIVDTLPRGILGELASLNRDIPAILVHRDITTSYANRPEVKTATRSFDLMLCPGERGPLEHHNIIETLPWVLLDACELLSRDAARAELGHHDDRPLAVVCDTTKPSESTGLKHLARHLEQAYGDAVRVIHAKLEETWPLMSLHRGIDLLIGAAGYNTVHEARLTGTTLRAIPRQRLYDCQDRRLMPRELLEDSDPPPIRAKQECTTYSNGAHDAILGIEGFVSR